MARQAGSKFLVRATAAHAAAIQQVSEGKQLPGVPFSSWNRKKEPFSTCARPRRNPGVVTGECLVQLLLKQRLLNPRAYQAVSPHHVLHGIDSG